MLVGVSAQSLIDGLSRVGLHILRIRVAALSKILVDCSIGVRKAVSNAEVIEVGNNFFTFRFHHLTLDIGD